MPLRGDWKAHLAGSYLEASPYAPTTPVSILKHPLPRSETSVFPGSSSSSLWAAWGQGGAGRRQPCSQLGAIESAPPEIICILNG